MRLAIHDQNVTLSARAIHLIKIQRDASESAELIQTPTTHRRAPTAIVNFHIFMRSASRVYGKRIQLKPERNKNVNWMHTAKTTTATTTAIIIIIIIIAVIDSVSIAIFTILYQFNFTLFRISAAHTQTYTRRIHSNETNRGWTRPERRRARNTGQQRVARSNNRKKQIVSIDNNNWSCLHFHIIYFSTVNEWPATVLSAFCYFCHRPVPVLSCLRCRLDRNEKLIKYLHLICARRMNAEQLFPLFYSNARTVQLLHACEFVYPLKCPEPHDVGRSSVVELCFWQVSSCRCFCSTTTHHLWC